MFLTCGVAELSQRVCLPSPQVTVGCDVVCVRVMTCVTHTGQDSNELWRFDTSKRVWEVVDNTVDIFVPYRSHHVMTCVGQDLWLYGGEGEGEGDVCWLRTYGVADALRERV
jgi:hypothetical protein